MILMDSDNPTNVAPSLLSFHLIPPGDMSMINNITLVFATAMSALPALRAPESAPLSYRPAVTGERG